MSYNFYSLVSSIKDKVRPFLSPRFDGLGSNSTLLSQSSQAMATLSSDLKEFTSIVQEVGAVESGRFDLF
jgi:hypothetical protein